MTTLEQILSGIVLLAIGGFITFIFANSKKVDCKTCFERRSACTDLLKNEMVHLKDLLEKIWKKFEDSKLRLL